MTSRKDLQRMLACASPDMPVEDAAALILLLQRMYGEELYRALGSAPELPALYQHVAEINDGEVIKGKLYKQHKTAQYRGNRLVNGLEALYLSRKGKHFTRAHVVQYRLFPTQQTPLEIHQKEKTP